jgi:L-iditol 2-dehydrogenase
MHTTAAVMIEPGRIELRAFDIPELEPGALLMEVDGVGICGSDKHMYLGHNALDFPVIPGHEVVGRVARMSPETLERIAVVGGTLSVGDRIAVVPGSQPCGRCHACLHYPDRPTLCSDRIVYGFTTCKHPPYVLGSYSRYQYIHPRSWVFKVPEAIDDDLGCLIEPTAVATRAVERAFAPGLPHVGEGFGLGKTALVLGAGPIGILCCGVLRFLGAREVIAVDAIASRLELAQKLGATETLNLLETTAAERLERVQSLTGGVGADVVIEFAGVPAAFEEGIELVRRGGKLVEAGHYSDSGAATVRPHTVCRKDLDILGMWGYPPMQFEVAIQFLRETTLPIRDLVTSHVALAETEDGIRSLGDEGVFKVIVRPGD